jgi:hypothetical protein
MDNLPDWANILSTYLMVAVIFNLFYQLDRRSKKEGPLAQLQNTQALNESSEQANP